MTPRLLIVRRQRSKPNLFNKLYHLLTFNRTRAYSAVTFSLPSHHLEIAIVSWASVLSPSFFLITSKTTRQRCTPYFRNIFTKSWLLPPKSFLAVIHYTKITSTSRRELFLYSVFKMMLFETWKHTVSFHVSTSIISKMSADSFH